MAHVVVVTQDPDVRLVLDVVLSVKGHVVMGVAEGAHALPALQLGHHSAVAIIHAPTPADGGLDLLRWAASDPAGSLGRHGYVILVDGAARKTAAALARAARLSARVIELPFDLDEVAAAVEDAECELLAHEWHARTGRIVPLRQSAEG